MRFAHYNITADSLLLHGLYGRKIPKNSIIKDGIKVINLDKSEYSPIIRTNGIGLPRYYEGWFKLRNGEKALLLVKGKSKQAVYIPTKNFSVMLSAKDPLALVESIKERTNSNNHM